MSDRASLSAKLHEILGSNNVYYQPPESQKLSYPCIIYSKQNIRAVFADNIKYRTTDQYQIILIGKKVDNPIIDELLKLPMSSYDRRYIADNLYHDVITLFY